MEWIESEAPSREEAKARLLAALDETDENNVEFEEMKVTRKFLGMGGRTVKLRGRLKGAPAKEESLAPAPAAVDVHGDRAAEPEPEEAEEAAPHKDFQEEKSAKPDKEQAPPAPSGGVTFASKYRPWASEGPSAIVIPPEGRGYGRRLFSLDPGEEDIDDLDDSRGKKGEREDEGFIPPKYEDDPDSPVTDEEKDRAVTLVSGLIEKMDMGGPVIGHKLSDRLLLVIESESGGLLIGRKGETLDSIQYLVDISLNRKREERIRVIVDAEYYKEKRRYKVFRIAEEAADTAARAGKPVRLNPMSPAERQIVHSTLADDSRVETISEGQGNRRKVVVYPKGRRQGKPKGGGRGGFGRGR